MISKKDLEPLLRRVDEYEIGQLPVEDILALFQDLITTGVVWGMPDDYVRIAKDLIDRGDCIEPSSTEDGIIDILLLNEK